MHKRVGGAEFLKRKKALLVQVPERSDWDLGDVLAVARSQGKLLFRTRKNVRVVWVHQTVYGYVVIIEGCIQPSGCKMEEKEYG